MACPDPGLLTGAWMPPFNLLTNGGFNFAQLQNPTSYTSISNGAVGPDGWRVAMENSGVLYARAANSSLFQSANRGSFQKTVSAGKIMIYQPLEFLLANGIGNHAYTMIVSVNLPSASYDFHIALMQWNGTPDVMTAPVATWNAPGTQPTLNTNWSFVQDDIIGSPGIGASEWSDERSTPAAGSYSNLAMAIYTDGQVSAGHYFELAEMGMYTGFGSRFTWTPLSPDEDLARCERLIEKTYATDTPASTSSFTDSIGTRQVGTSHIEPVRYRVRKVKTPAISLYNPNTGTSAQWYDSDAASNISMTANDIGTSGFTAAVVGTGNDGNTLKGHFVADASI